MKVNGYYCTLEAISAGDDESQLIILVHGFPDSPKNWQPVIDRLAESGYKVIAPWLKGYSPSQAIPPFNIGTIGLDIIEIALNYSGKNKAIIIGHDFGAMGAYCAANLRGDLFEKIVTMSVPPFGAIFEGFLTTEQLKKSWYIFFHQTFLAEIVLPMNNFEYIDRLWSDWGPESTPNYKEFTENAKLCFADPENIQAALGYYRSIFDLTENTDNNIAAALSAFQQAVVLPTLYLHGSDDGCIGIEVGNLASKYLNNQSKSKIIKNSGHFLQIDAPTEMLAEINEFLSK